jgi:hypothetical protein
MRRGLKALVGSAALFAGLSLLAAGCGSSHNAATTATTTVAPAKPSCAFPAGWRALANRIRADVYCPGWLPDPLTSQIGGQSNNIDSVSKDRSYLESFIWQDTDTPNISGEVHVILRGYPGRVAIPKCLGGLKDTSWIPCFAGPRGHVASNGIKATVFTVNQDADSWHLLLAWHHKGGLYTLSEHLAPPLTFKHVMAYLKHELGSLVLVAPTRSST